MIYLLLVAIAASWFNTGFIWMVQLVHYPGFRLIDSQSSHGYHTFHMQAITPLVWILIVVEMISNLGIVFELGTDLKNLLPLIAFLILILIWTHTVVIAIPLHKKLTEEFDNQTIKRLIQTNWWRTIGWTIKSVLLSYTLFELLSA